MAAEDLVEAEVEEDPHVEEAEDTADLEKEGIEGTVTETTAEVEMTEIKGWRII